MDSRLRALKGTIGNDNIVGFLPFCKALGTSTGQALLHEGNLRLHLLVKSVIQYYSIFVLSKSSTLIPEKRIAPIFNDFIDIFYKSRIVGPVYVK